MVSWTSGVKFGTRGRLFHWGSEAAVVQRMTRPPLLPRGISVARGSAPPPPPPGVPEVVGAVVERMMCMEGSMDLRGHHAETVAPARALRAGRR